MTSTTLWISLGKELCVWEPSWDKTPSLSEPLTLPSQFPVTEILPVTNDCVIVRNTAGHILACSRQPPRCVAVHFSLGKDFNLSREDFLSKESDSRLKAMAVVRRPALRWESATVSGLLVVQLNSHSLFVTSIKSVVVALEQEDEKIEHVNVHLSRVIWSELEVQSMTTIGPDLLFTASESTLTVYTLKD